MMARPTTKELPMPDLTFLQLLLIFTLAAMVVRIVAEAMLPLPESHRLNLGEPDITPEDVEEAMDRR